MLEHRVRLKGAWYAGDDDGVDADLIVDGDDENMVAHIETPDGMVSIRVDELDAALEALCQLECQCRV